MDHENENEIIQNLEFKQHLKQFTQPNSACWASFFLCIPFPVNFQELTCIDPSGGFVKCDKVHIPFQSVRCLVLR